MRRRSGLAIVSKRKPKWPAAQSMAVTTLLCGGLLLVIRVSIGRFSLSKLRTRHDGLQRLVVQGQESRCLGRCAINFYGLPRSFQRLVLPSLLENVVRPNSHYRCDYFVHYHYRLSEPLGRDGRGGDIDPDEILLVQSAIINASDYHPTVAFIKTTEEDFAREYQGLLHELHTGTDADGNPIYVPINHPSYDNNTVDNVIKMFHGQSAVWNLMVSHEQVRSRQHLYHYSRIAMLRNDVFFATPVDIYNIPDGSKDYHNRFAVIPGFSQHPVNDRLIYGPRDAIRIWAASRFERLWAHVLFVQKHHPGDGIHSERFLAYTILPAIQDAGIPVDVDSKMCFMRVRSDQSIRLDDCRLSGETTDSTQLVVERILGHTCHRNSTQSTLIHLECSIP